MSNTQPNEDNLDQIVVIEDDPNAISFLNTTLGNQGYHIIVAANVDTAKGHILSGGVKCVLFGETKEIKDEEKPQALQSLAYMHPDIPIIAMVRYDDPYVTSLEPHTVDQVERPDGRTIDKLVESVNNLCKKDKFAADIPEKTNVLIVDDESNFADILSRFLNKKGYNTSVVFDDVVSAKEEALSGKYQFIMLSVMQTAVLSMGSIETPIMMMGYFPECKVSSLGGLGNVVGYLSKSSLEDLHSLPNLIQTHTSTNGK